MKQIHELCGDAVRLREAVRHYKMMARCAEDELKIVDYQIIEWSDAE